MSCIQRIFSLFLVGLVSTIMCLTVQAQTETTSTTQVDPVTQQSTTTSVNPTTQETTITQTNLNTGQSTTTIITPAPAPQEAIVTPTGYVNCFTVAAGWYKGVWVPEHKVCQYDVTKGTYQGAIWIEGHWACTQYQNTACTKWEWKSARWVQTLEVY